jgi:hypothetical protein
MDWAWQYNTHPAKLVFLDIFNDNDEETRPIISICSRRGYKCSNRLRLWRCLDTPFKANLQTWKKRKERKEKKKKKRKKRKEKFSSYQFDTC